MAKINLSEIKAGMITSEPLRIQNRVILGEGVAITEKHIHLFKTWGIDFVDIKRDSIEEGEVASSLSPEQKKVLLDEIAKRFSLVDGNSAVMNEIKRIAEKLILNKES